MYVSLKICSSCKSILLKNHYFIYFQFLKALKSTESQYKATTNAVPTDIPSYWMFNVTDTFQNAILFFFNNRSSCEHAIAKKKKTFSIHYELMPWYIILMEYLTATIHASKKKKIEKRACRRREQRRDRTCGPRVR